MNLGTSAKKAAEAFTRLGIILREIKEKHEKSRAKFKVKNQSFHLKGGGKQK